MNSKALKTQLWATGPRPFHCLKQNAALKALAASSSSSAAGFLAAAVDGSHRLSGKILPILSATKEQAWIDYLCDLWAAQRQDGLGRMICANKWTGGRPGTDTLCTLKAGLQDRLPMDSQSVASIFSAPAACMVRFVNI